MVNRNYKDTIFRMLFSDRENLLFNQIVAYEKRADFDTAKSLMADFLAAYPENTTAQRENTFLQNR